MRKDILLPGVAVAGGAAGFLLRRWELSTAFEPDTGLPVAGAPATWALIALTVVVAAVLAVLCRGTHRVFPGGYDEAFGAPNNALYLTVLVAAAFLMAASGLLTFLLYLRHDVTAFSRVLLALMSLVSAACLFVVGKNNYRMEGRGKYSAALLLPSYTCCLWLISAYQARSADPVILDYVYQLFAVIAAVLGTYFTAGFAFERAKVFRALLLLAAGRLFLPGDPGRPPRCVHAAAVCGLRPLPAGHHRPSAVQRRPAGGPANALPAATGRYRRD